MERAAYVWDSMMTFFGDLIKQRLSNDIEFIIKEKPNEQLICIL